MRAWLHRLRHEIGIGRARRDRKAFELAVASWS
jgi:hypothetical protein